MTTTPLLQPEKTLERLGGDRELLREIHVIFLEDAPERFASLTDALDRRDQSLVVKYAHALKGMAGSVDAAVLADLTARMEHHARNQELDAACALRRNCDRVFADTVAAVTEQSS